MSDKDKEDKEVERLLAIWERADRFFWRKVSLLLMIMGIGAIITYILTIILIWVCVFFI